jgi:hypothetical protein
VERQTNLSINDTIFDALRQAGYTGALPDMQKQFFSDMYPNTGAFPSGLGWDTTNFNFTTNLANVAGRSYGSISVTPEALFDARSTARSAPGATYYVGPSGNDTTGNGLTSGTAWRTIDKAIQAANTAAVPTKIYVATGTYSRGNSFAGFGGTRPAVDIAFIATGGRVVAGNFDDYTAPTSDATHTNTYSATLSNVDDIVDLTNLDANGNYGRLTYVASAAICNITPNSWHHDGTKYYIRRRDNVAPTSTNTRIYRGGTYVLQVVTPISIYLGADDDYSGFDLEGTSTKGALDYGPTTTPGSRKAVVVKNCTFKYCGNKVNTSARAVSVDSIHGIAAFFDCWADRAATDAFNFHNTTSATAVPYVLTVNCVSLDTGQPVNTSVNALTIHEDVKAIDIAGYYGGSNGGTVRNIGTSKHLLIGTILLSDKGERAFNALNGVVGGAFANYIRTQDTAIVWCDRVQVNAMPGQTAFWADAGTAIYLRRVWPTRGGTYAAGTVTTY